MEENPLSRRKNRALAQIVDNTVNFNTYLQQQQQLNHQRRSVQLNPKTANQKHYVDLLLDEDVQTTFDPARTGRLMKERLEQIQDQLALTSK